MGRSHNFDGVYTAIYVDFDNIFSRIAEQDQNLARTFATYPQRWLRWLESHAIRIMYGDAIRRRIIKKACYINLQRHNEFKPYFIRNGFHVVDSPSYSPTGKTNAPVQMTIDCLDTLEHSTYFDEFILLSGDADLTPTLLRLQEHARKTLVLSIGYTSPAFASACSWRVREDWFLTQALDDGDDTREPREERHDNRTNHEERKVFIDKKQPEASKNGNSLHLPAAKRSMLIDVIKQLVAESNVPVSLPTLSQVFQHEHETPPDWFGAGTLRDLLQSLDLTPLAFSQLGQGAVFDPSRHENPEATNTRKEFKHVNQRLYEFASKANQLLDIPLLKPDQYKKLFILLVEEVNAHPFSRTNSIPLLVERCEEEGLAVTAEQIAFVVDAIIATGYPLGKAKHTASVPEVTKAFSSRAAELCSLAEMPFGEYEQQLLQEWLLG